MKISYRKIFLVVFLVWAVLWINFTIRDLTRKKYLKEYKELLARDTAGKASYTYGDRLFEFLKFCRDSLPEGASYAMTGVEVGSIDSRRAIYYLYPHTEEADADYILVFDTPGYTHDGYAAFKELDRSRFILKRAR